MSRLPGLYWREFAPRNFIHREHPLIRGSDVVLDPSVRSTSRPDFRIPEGTVVVRRAGSRLYVAATDPRGERCAPAEVLSSQAPDPTWANQIVTASLAPGLGFTVLLDQAAVGIAEVTDQLNRDPLFSAHFLADDMNGLVRIRTREAGAHKLIHVSSSLLAAFGPLGVEGRGRDPDYRVTEATVEVQDLEGKPLEALVPTVAVGHFKTLELLQATAEALAVLTRRGSLFHPTR